MLGFHRQGIMCEMSGSQHQTCSETGKARTMFSASLPEHGALVPSPVVVREGLVKP